MTPEVSILLPVRNEERHLPAALASICRQTLQKWELVAVDDGSTDNTPSILDAAARQDGRIRILLRPAEGLVATLNAGLEACAAPLVARMDGDDISHPRRLELQASWMAAHPHVAVLGCRVRHFPRPALQGGMLAYEEWQNGLSCETNILRDLFVESPFVHPSVMFRRDMVLQAGGYRCAPWSEDYDLWLRLAASGSRFARLPQTLFFWRDRPERITRTSPLCSADAFRACKAHYLRKGVLKGVKGVTLWGAGAEGKAWRKALGAVGIKVHRWAEVDPRKIAQTIHGAPVVSIDELHPGEGPTLITVGAKGAREQVRAWASERGFREFIDFIYVT